jgi:ligand-binding SRPBCC domain-containing protein
LIALEFRSRVAAPPDVVWRVVATMDGVNAELAPWLRMTHPPDRADLRAQMVPPGAVVFHSWLLLFGVLPVDRHALSFESLHERGFDERSTSWSNRIWIHRRRVEPDGDGSQVMDQLWFEPRLSPLAPLVRRFVGALFRHRHARLRARFGTRAT